MQDKDQKRESWHKISEAAKRETKLLACYLAAVLGVMARSFFDAYKADNLYKISVSRIILSSIRTLPINITNSWDELEQAELL